MIPKIIHYTGPTNKNKWHPIWNTCLESWFKQFPKYEYEHIFWTDDQLDDLIRSSYPQYLEFYNNLPYHLMRIDFAEYLLIHKYGGIYHDLDMFCYKNFYHNIKEYNCVLLEGLSPREFVQNSMFASESNNDFWIYLIDKIIKEFYINPIDSNGEQAIEHSYYILDTICCHVTSRAAIKYTKPLHILPKRIYNPHHLTYEKEYITKHMLTGLWGKETISVFENDYDQSTNLNERYKKNYSIARGVYLDNFDFYKDYRKYYTGDSV